MSRMPQVLETLKQTAIIESTESSNRIEGVTVPAKRFKELMVHPVKPKDRSEAEILGYREILSSIHTKPETFLIEETIDNLPSTFSISDIERLLSTSVSRDMIRVILNRLRKEGHLFCKGTGRGALWEKRGNSSIKRGNKRGNNEQENRLRR